MGEKFSSLEDFEEEAERYLRNLGKSLPLEVVINTIQEINFKPDGDNYLSSEFSIGRAVYYTSLVKNTHLNKYGLSLWKGKPKDGGTFIRDYQDDERIAELYGYLRRKLESYQ